MAALRNASQDKVVATHFLIITDLFFGISGPDDITKLLSYLRFETHSHGRRLLDLKTLDSPLESQAYPDLSTGGGLNQNGWLWNSQFPTHLLESRATTGKLPKSRAVFDH